MLGSPASSDTSASSARDLLARLRDVDAESNHEMCEVSIDWMISDDTAPALLISSLSDEDHAIEC